MNKFLDNLLFGKKENRIVILETFAVPDNTNLPDAEVEDLPHFCIKDGVPWIWKADTHVWTKFTGSDENLRDPVAFLVDGTYDLDEAYMIWKIVYYASADIPLKIGTTPGGGEILDGSELAPQFRFLSITIDLFKYDDHDTLYISGIPDGENVQIIFHKLKNLDLV